MGEHPVSRWAGDIVLAAVSAVGWATASAGDWAGGTAVGIGAAVALIWRLVTDHRIAEERDAIVDDLKEQRDHAEMVADRAMRRAEAAEVALLEVQRKHPFG
jgi:hypothetical protein